MTSNIMNNLRPFIFFFLGASSATFFILFYLSSNTTPEEKASLDLLLWRKGENTTHKRHINETMMGLTQEDAYQDLGPLLQRAAMDDKTVILTTVNEAFAAPNSLLDLFLESFRIGEGIEHLLDHLIVVAMDSKAFDRCMSVHAHCFFHKINGTNFTSEKVFMTRGYIEIVWSKIRLQRRILELGYNFLFTDVDILWFRDPRRHISIDADLTTSSDRFFGNPDDLRNWPNTGLFYVKSTEKNIAMLRYWDEARARFPPNHEQNVFNRIKGELVGKLGVKIRFVDTAFCGGFCEYGKDLNKICTMHANCCVTLRKKLQDLRSILEDWKNFTSLSPEEKRRGLVTWRVSGSCLR